MTNPISRRPRPRTVNNFLSRCELHELTEKQLYQSFQSRNFRSTVNHPYAEKQGRKQKKKKKNQRHSLTEKRGIYYIFVKFNNAIETTRRLHPRFCDKMSVSERLMSKTPTWSKNSLKAGHTTSLGGETWLLPCLGPLLQSTLKDSL